MTQETKSDRKWLRGQAHDAIVTVGDPRLQEPVRPVADLAAGRDVVDRMVELLRDLNGAGLAAPQIGESISAVVVEVRKTDVFPDRPESPLVRMFNPEIIWYSSDLEEGWEGCFSVPGIMGRVSRSKEITVRYLSVDGERVEDKFTGYVARVVGHEIDHLSNVEFLDRMTSMESITTAANYVKFHRG